MSRHFLEIDWCGRPVSANTWHGLHWRDKAATVALWRGYGIQAARLAKLPKNVDSFTATIQFRYRNGRLTDADNCAPTWKALCDGLIDYGLAPDDTPDHFGGVTLLPPLKDPAKPHAVLVEIVVA